MRRGRPTEGFGGCSEGIDLESGEKAISGDAGLASVVWVKPGPLFTHTTRQWPHIYTQLKEEAHHTWLARTTQQANHAPSPSEWGMRVGAAYTQTSPG